MGNPNANALWLYLLGAIVVVFVLAGSLFFIIRAYKEAKELNMDKKVLRKTVFNSAVFTILPSVSILLGVIALSGQLGIPLPWIRLTVIGALHYEGTAAKAAIEAFSKLGINEITNEVFVTIACVMTLGILTGPLFCLLGFKAYDKKVLAKAKAPSEENKETSVEEETKPVPSKPKKSFGSILFNAVFIAMVSSFLAVDIVKIFDTGKQDVKPMDSYAPTIVICSTFLAMFIFDILEKKCKMKWLSSFSLGLSMLIGMAVAVLVG